MIAQIGRPKHAAWRHFDYAAAIAMLLIALSSAGAARADDENNFNIKLYPEVTTALYFDSNNKLLWVELLTNVKDRDITPIEDTKLMAIVPFKNGKYPDNSKVKAEKHFDCATCPEKKADKVTSGVAAKAVYCGRTGARNQEGTASPLFVEDLGNVESRLIELAATADPSPCPFPKKCHCSQGACCCW